MNKIILNRTYGWIPYINAWVCPECKKGWINENDLNCPNCNITIEWKGSWE